MFFLCAVLLSLTSFCSVAQAWGTVGHDTVALIATSYLSDLAVDYFADILDGDELVDIATWADSYRYTAAGAWSAGMHYIDAEDNPPDTCHVTYPADCGTFCIVEAIANYVRPSEYEFRCTH